MTGVSDINIKELKLRIPKDQFPLKSDLIKGYRCPELIMQDDECSWGEVHEGKEDGSDIVWDLHDVSVVEGRDCWTIDLEELCKKYKGTLIAEYNSEDPGEPTDHVRIRDGVKKKITIVEED